MIDYSKQFNDIMAQIQAQYKGSNVAQLIEGIIEIKKKGVLRAYKSLIDDCLNLSTAKGDALDLWGYILGINRFVPRDSNQDAKENFKQWNFNKSNFKHLIFLQVRDQLYHRLADDDFRNLLLLFLQRQYIFASPREAQSLIDDYISKKYGELNILDTQKMAMKAEFSFNDYPEWMRWYILLKDIIPRPAGVKIDMIETPEPEPLALLAPEPEILDGGLRFTAQEANSSVTLNPAGLNELQLEYRTDTSSAWQNYTLGTEINLLNIGSWVEMRNRGLQDFYNIDTFTMTGKIAASGSIMYLLDKTGKIDSLRAYAFARLFSNCSNLTTPPELPATTLASYCYSNMFEGCSNLTIPPELPAKTLAANCYNGMFQYCTSLTKAPSLPATNLAAGCYMLMFFACDNLTTPPELPATNLAANCYSNMFRACYNLETLPSLPATTLAYGCYSHMFAGAGRNKLTVNENGSGTKIFTCPSTSGLGYPTALMFWYVGDGTFDETPKEGNTYYFKNKEDN